MAFSRNQVGNESSEFYTIDPSFQPYRPHAATALSPYPAGSNDEQSATDSRLATGPEMGLLPELEPLTAEEEMIMIRLLYEQEQMRRINNQILLQDQQGPNQWTQPVSYGAPNLAQPGMPLSPPPSQSGLMTAPLPAIVEGAPTANSVRRRGRGRGRGNWLPQRRAATCGRFRPILPAPTTDGYIPMVFPVRRNRAPEESLSQEVLQGENLERHRTRMNHRFATMRTPVPPTSLPATANMTRNDRPRILTETITIFSWSSCVTVIDPEDTRVD